MYKMRPPISSLVGIQVSIRKRGSERAGILTIDGNNPLPFEWICSGCDVPLPCQQHNPDRQRDNGSGRVQERLVRKLRNLESLCLQGSTETQMCNTDSEPGDETHQPGDVDEPRKDHTITKEGAQESDAPDPDGDKESWKWHTP